MVHALALTAGSIGISLSSLFLWNRKDDAPLLFFLYVCVAAAFLAWFSLPLIDWTPEPSAM